MSVNSPSRLDLGWPARTALRLFPQSWRDEYETEVTGTLLDLADAHPQSVVPVTEIAHLAWRGMVLRARSSLTFWGGLIIVVLMVVFAALQPAGFVVERYWTTILASAGAGLTVVLPVAAALGAWQGHRATRGNLPHAGGAAARMLRMAVLGLAILGFVMLGYVLAGVTLLIASGAPSTWNADLRIPLAYLLMSAGAIALGYLLGLVVHAGIAMPVAFVAAALWYSAGPAWSPGVIGWRDITGVSLSQCCGTLSDAPAAITLMSVSLIAIGLIALALGIAAVSRGGTRLLPFVLGLGIAASVFATVAPTIEPNAQRIGEARDPGSLICEGSAPQVCMWPEQEAANGSHVRELLSDAYQKGLALGLPMRETITSPFTGQRVSETATPFTQLYWNLAADDDRILTNYAQATTQSAGCQLTPTTAGGFGTQLAVDYAIARELGASDAAALPRLSHSADARLPDTVLNPSEARAELGVTSPASMNDAISIWKENLDTCKDK
jgi:hypothetical protein